MKLKEKPDALIFDVDGVLLDVSRSFPEVIRQTILKGWVKFCGGISDSKGYTEEHEYIMKRHGAFNDDYDLAWALLSISAASGSKKLSEAFPSPRHLEKEIETFSGTVESWVHSRYGDLVPRRESRVMCNALYFGNGKTRGLHCLETPMVHCHWSRLPLAVGLYTGRDIPELTAGEEMLEWQDFPLDNVVHSESGVCKPSPEGLEILCERFGAKNPIFFGDTASDYLAYKAFGRGYFAAIGSLLPEAEYRFKDTEEALAKLINFRTGS